jgi:hydrogenase maturation protein HypF
MSELSGARIHLTGVIQGVGFRPFVYGLAHRLHLTGWVRNTSAGVDIEADGLPEDLDAFARALRREAPPLAQIDSLVVESRPPNGLAGFEILHSAPIPGAFQPISPDVSICDDCRRELFDPGDRRYRYPFINCTNCGPRFTIIQDIPYDRPLTTMAPFPMCPNCAAEYEDPLDRRFHAQPVACPDCGPVVWLVDRDEPRPGDDRLSGEAGIQAAREWLAQGLVVAVKGLGGFHLACDATSPAAVERLRQRKLRVDKPFAVMMADLVTVEAHCYVNPAEREMLTSRQRPIVILRRRPDSAVVAQCAPGQDTLGVMLPYTPLHYLLLEPAAGFPQVLVMTSGNLAEEPIATGNEAALSRLSGLADAFLLHDRDIHTRCDDAVVRVFEGEVYPIRRSRGYAPYPVKLPWPAPPLLATGAEMKNVFCLTKEGYAFLSHHIGEMENFETLTAFEEGVEHFERLFRVSPAALAYDLHPDYLATRYALDRAASEGLPAIGVQHHHAHIAALMAEHGLTGDRPVIGVAFDGTGYGEDGAIWGGEFLVAGYEQYERAYYLAYVPMPGGDLAVRQPWRLALAWLRQAGLPWDEALPPVAAAGAGEVPGDPLAILERQLVQGLNAPLTSSMGRLFDAVAAIAGVRQRVNYEAQAAIELEAAADPHETRAYPLEIGAREVDPSPLIRAAAADVRAGAGPAVVSARFHNGLALMTVEVCRRLRASTGLSHVALSGGVWQNVTLLGKTVSALRAASFAVYLHRQAPANDGGLALGQAAVAARRLGAA